MRTASKAHAKPGHSKARMYRENVFSVATDLEAMIDAYGVEAVISFARKIESDIREYGDSIHNGIYNIQLNMLPAPLLRVQNKPENLKLKKRRAA